jgi:ankyrin repeat protein
LFAFSHLFLGLFWEPAPLCHTRRLRLRAAHARSQDLYAHDESADAQQTGPDFALRTAAEDGDIGSVKALLAAGADVHAMRDSALWLAAENGHTGIVEALLDAGADVHAVEDAALRRAAANGHTETVWTLLEAGADVQARNGAALRLATIGGHPRAALFLSEWIRHGGSCQPEDRLRT